MNDDIIELIKISFDTLENRISNAISEKSLGMFTSSKGLTAQGNVSRFIAKLSNIKMYVGWDCEVYPKYKIIIHKVNK